MKFYLLTTVLLAITIDSALSATCTYDHSSNRISCGGVTCSTVGAVSGGKLPIRNYRIGTFYTHGNTPWFNLYPMDVYTATKLGIFGSLC